MRVFLAYGYLPQEMWIEELVVPMLRQMGLTLIDGKEIPGEEINEEVRQRISSSDALIGLLTKRRKLRGGRSTTSDYVRQEIEIALGAKYKPVVQVVEIGVSPPGGMLSTLQRLRYDPKRKHELLLNLTRHVGLWTQGEMRVRLVPEALAEAVARDPDRAECTYKIIQDNRTHWEGQAELFPDGGGIFAKLLGFRPGTEALVNVITPQGKRWVSRVVPHSSPFAVIELTQT